jgi:hypothetical protein
MPDRFVYELDRGLFYQFGFATRSDLAFGNGRPFVAEQRSIQ